MYALQLASVTQSQSVTIRLDVPTPGVVLVDADFGGAFSPVPLHWRVGDWTKPPVDVALNPTDGSVQAVQVVLVDEAITPQGAMADQAVRIGVPIVSLNGWPSGRYRDVRFKDRSSRSPNGELVTRVAETQPVTFVGERGLILGWDRDQHLCQVRIGPLSSNDWNTIESNLAQKT